MNTDKNTELENRLLALGRTFPYPRTPDVSSGMKRLPSPPGGPARIGWVRTLGVILALALGLLAVPTVRAAVAEFIQIGSIRVFLEDILSGREESLAGTGSQFTIENWQAFSGEITYEAAIQRFGQSIPLPSYPPDLGLPDKLFYQVNGGEILILLWTGTEEGALTLSLIILGPGSFIGKGGPAVIQETTVRGQDALWLEGNHELVLQAGDPPGERILQVTGNVLIWEQSGRTFRLEGQFTLAEATRIAESIP